MHAVGVFPSVSAFEHSDAVPPRGTLLVSGSLHTVTQTEQTPVPVPRLVLINYQQRLYPAAAGGKPRVKRNRRECGMHSSTTGVPAYGVRATKIRPLDMSYYEQANIFLLLFDLCFFSLI